MGLAPQLAQEAGRAPSLKFHADRLIDDLVAGPLSGPMSLELPAPVGPASLEQPMLGIAARSTGGEGQPLFGLGLEQLSLSRQHRAASSSSWYPETPLNSTGSGGLVSMPSRILNIGP